MACPQGKTKQGFDLQASCSVPDRPALHAASPCGDLTPRLCLVDLQLGTNVHGHAALLEDLLPHLTAQVSSQPSPTGSCNDSFYKWLPDSVCMCRGTLYALCGFPAKATGSLSGVALEWTLMTYTIPRARGHTVPFLRESHLRSLLASMAMCCLVTV